MTDTNPSMPSLFSPIPQGQAEITMSSREIADLTGKEHKNVKRDIEKLLADLSEDALKFEHIYLDSMNRQQTEYMLDRDTTENLLLGYSPILRKKVLARLRELEGNHRPVTVNDLLSNPVQLLTLAQGYALQIEDMKREIVVMQKDVDVLDRIAKADDLYGLRQSAQILQMPERKLTDWLMRNKWCFRHTGNSTIMAYSEKRRAGYVTHKLTTFPKPDGTEGTRETVKFTTSGIVQLAKRLNVVISEGDLFLKLGVAS